jgi:hypothetical protein
VNQGQWPTAVAEAYANTEELKLSNINIAQRKFKTDELIAINVRNIT